MFLFRRVATVICLILFFASAASALPTTIRLEVGGLGLGNSGSPFDLPLNTTLIQGQQYKVLIRAWDNDTDGIATRVHNFTFNLTITNGTVNSFSWLANGWVNDNNHLNTITGNSITGYDAITGAAVIIPASTIDKPNQVSTDIPAYPSQTFPIPNTNPVQYWNFPGHEIRTSPKLDLAVVYFTAEANPSQLRIDFDSDKYTVADGFATDNSHYSVDGNSYQINQGQGLVFRPSLTHPADANGDFVLSSTEALSYIAAFKQATSWPRPPSPITTSYALICRALFKQGPSYHMNPNYTCSSPDPNPASCWTAGP